MHWHVILDALVCLLGGGVGVLIGHYWDVLVTKRNWRGWDLG